MFAVDNVSALLPLFTMLAKPPIEPATAEAVIADAVVHRHHAWRYAANQVHVVVAVIRIVERDGRRTQKILSFAAPFFQFSVAESQLAPSVPAPVLSQRIEAGPPLTSMRTILLAKAALLIAKLVRPDRRCRQHRRADKAAGSQQVIRNGCGGS